MQGGSFRQSGIFQLSDQEFFNCVLMLMLNTNDLASLKDLGGQTSKNFPNSSVQLTSQIFPKLLC